MIYTYHQMLPMMKLNLRQSRQQLVIEIMNTKHIEIIDSYLRSIISSLKILNIVFMYFIILRTYKTCNEIER
jgi:hypothetical protein